MNNDEATDTMRRIAIQDPLSDVEMGMVTETVARCPLYVILNAAFAKARHEGLTLYIDVRKPGKKGRGRR